MKNFLGNNNIIDITKDRIDDLPNVLSYYIDKSCNNNTCLLNFLINFEKYDSFTNLSKIYLEIKKIVPFYKNCNFYIDLKENILSKKELEILKKFSQMLKIDGINLEFREYGAIWSSDEVFSTYEFLESEVKKVKDLNLSPFETFLCYYNQLTSRIYNQESQNENSLLSRSIIGINNSDKIVCAGYAHWLFALIKCNDNKDIWSMPIILEMFQNKQKFGYHKTNMVYIRDEKYGINGLYYVDTCWDSIKASTEKMRLNFCLIPLDDPLFYCKDFILSATKPMCGYNYILDGIKPQSFLDFSNQSCLKFLENIPLVDLEKLRQKFAQKVIAQAETYNIDKSEDYLEKLKIQLASRPEFSSPHLEYSFLKYVCNKIKRNSKPIDLSCYTQALLEMSTKYLKLSPLEAKEYIDDIITNTKQASVNLFKHGAKNVFYTLYRAEYNRQQERIKQIKERHQQILERKRKKEQDSQKE